VRWYLGVSCLDVASGRGSNASNLFGNVTKRLLNDLRVCTVYTVHLQLAGDLLGLCPYA